MLIDGLDARPRVVQGCHGEAKAYSLHRQAGGFWLCREGRHAQQM